MAKNIVLEKTVPLMLSDDYKERFVAEYKQTVNRRNKLKKMLADHTAGKLDFKPACPIELLKDQLTCMNKYVDILKKRAEIEKINLK